VGRLGANAISDARSTGAGSPAACDDVAEMTSGLEPHLEIGGAGGPAGGTGGSDGGGGVEIVSAGAGAAYDIAAESPLEPAAADTEGEGEGNEPVDGAGVTGGTGSTRSADVSLPVSLAGSVLAGSVLPGSVLADSDLPSPPTLSLSGLLGSLLADSLFGISPVPGASLAVSALGSSPGFPRRLKRCLADNLRPSGPRSTAACGGTWLSTSTREA
jgi:hypothetical protein